MKAPLNQQKPKTAGKASLQPVTPSWQHWLAVSAIVLVTFICFQPALNNHFLKTWDDSVYVTGNKLINGLTGSHISEIFTFKKDLQKLTKNYHPLTTLSLAVNHQFAGLNPPSYYLTNILIHILNSLLVYLLIFLLTERRFWGALFAGVLFGIHPMHVESVAWISERKDVLYAFFFISGLIVYYFYVREQKPRYLAVVFLLFFLSVLSKAMAVVFPLTLFILDFLLQRKWNFRLVIEKIPFFIVSAFFGILAVKIQSDGAMNDFHTYTFFQRIMHASYGFLSYLYNFAAPFNLSGFYPYPFITDHGLLPLSFRVAPFVVVVILALATGCLFLKNRLARMFAAGMFFYLVTLVMVLQFISVGKAITADRYTYLPYIGVLLIMATLFTWLIENSQKTYKMAGLGFAALLIIVSGVFAAQTRQRVTVWHDDFTLWNDVLNQFPDVRLNFIREKRASLNFQNNDFDPAMKDYQVIASLDPQEDEALNRIGQIYGQHLHLIDSSMVWFNKAYQVNPGNISLLKNMGVAYAIKTDYTRAIDLFLRAYAKDPSDTSLVYNIAATYHALGNTVKAAEFDNLFRKGK